MYGGGFAIFPEQMRGDFPYMMKGGSVMEQNYSNVALYQNYLQSRRIVSEKKVPFYCHWPSSINGTFFVAKEISPQALGEQRCMKCT